MTLQSDSVTAASKSETNLDRSVCQMWVNTRFGFAVTTTASCCTRVSVLMFHTNDLKDNDKKENDLFHPTFLLSAPLEY